MPCCLPVDPAVASAWAHTNNMPLLGAAQLWRWEKQAFRFGELAAGKLPQVLNWARGLQWRELRTSVWQAAARVVVLWGARQPNRFWLEVQDGRELANLAVEQLDTELGEGAANLLVALHRNRVSAVPPLLPRVREMLPAVSFQKWSL